ncbi:hypothetical protein F5Y19DRAFT_320972 [Xylariaceae sp. FL1651]|nr:hypothetical protein F5Y19DRAFT_320972 [Xylariaceae sp. FL1651]
MSLSSLLRKYTLYYQALRVLAMRLFCAIEDGETLEIQAAARRYPLETRGLLMDALLFCGQEEILPDTLAALEVEHSLRVALAHFSGEQEKYVRNYMLARRLDHRVQPTPRAELIASALQTGGPLALTALFYATHNAHHSYGARKTLESLLNSVTETSRRDLFRRAGGFPVHASFKAWFNRLLDKDLDAFSVACMLHCLGTPSIPRLVFTRFREAPMRKAWGLDGEVQLHAPNISPVIEIQEVFDDALKKLEALGFIRATFDTIWIDKRLAAFIEDRPEMLAWKVKATQLFAHILPVHPVLAPQDYLHLHETMLPQLKHIVTYLQEADVLSFLGQGPGPGLHETAELCIATSYFSDFEWRKKALYIADLAIQAYERARPNLWTNQVFRMRIAVRRAYHSLLQNAAASTKSEASQQHTTILRDTAWANAFSAELVLLRAYESIKNDDFGAALSELSNYGPTFGSTLERAQNGKIEVVRGVVYRLQGRFRESYEVLDSVPDPGGGVGVLTRLSAVMCELGQHDRAIAKIHGWLQLCVHPASRAAARARLSFADAHLIRGLRRVLSGRTWSDSSCQDVQAMYQDLRSNSQLRWCEHAAVLIGIAISKHMGGEIEAATCAWEAVRSYCKEVQLPPGHVESMVDLSICELELRKGRTAEPKPPTARKDFAGGSQQYLFAGLGTVWLNTLDDWFVAHGHGRISV